MLKTSNAADTICEAAVRVFETSAFMSVWPWQSTDDATVVCDSGATMTFSGSHSGRISLKVSHEIFPTLVQNMVGECETADEIRARAADALCEALNMICGNLLTDWYGEQAIFDLQPPRPVTLEEINALHDATSVCAVLCLENTRAEVLAELN